MCLSLENQFSGEKTWPTNGLEPNYPIDHPYPIPPTVPPCPILSYRVFSRFTYYGFIIIPN